MHPPERVKFEAEIIASARAAGAQIIPASDLRTSEGIARIAQLNAEMGVSAMFGYLLKSDFLDLLPKGCINLHPAYLPYNRGAYPNVWSIVDQTPAGVTLHYVDAGIDTGDIIRQKKVAVLGTDTGETLYHKLETAGLQLLRESWPDIQAGRIERTPQPRESGTSRRVICPAGEDVIGPYLADKRAHLKTIVDPLTTKAETIYVSRDANSARPRRPGAFLTSASAGFRPPAPVGSSQGIPPLACPLSFQPGKAAGLSATYPFTCTGPQAGSRRRSQFATAGSRYSRAFTARSTSR